LKLRVGDWVEVRSKEGILRSLDKNGRLEELPFMPQMFNYCGQQFRVFKRAHKTCDTVDNTGGRRVLNAVHLEVRCDGEAYGGCQAACLIFWKEAWLKPVDREGRPDRKLLRQQSPPARDAGCTEADVWAGTRRALYPDEVEPRYICQAIQLPYFTTLLPWWNMMQYLEDFTSGNVTVGQLIRGGIYAFFSNLVKSGIGVGRPLRWLYDRFQALYGGVPFPGRGGRILRGHRTPTCTLDLQPGELVRVKSYKEILATLDVDHENHGLYFDAEEVIFCGGIYRVRARVNKYLDEKSGRLKTLRNTQVILENVWCQARYSHCRMFCPRSIYSWWREIWLERVSENTAGLTETEPVPSTRVKRARRRF
jgi:hypothetical protein